MADKKSCAWCNRPLPEQYIAVTVPNDRHYEARFCSEKCYSDYKKAGAPVVSVYKKGDCFITTAVCKTLNKADDCAELISLRNFRDTFMQDTPEMHEEIHEYYHIAPQICTKIEKEKDSGAKIYTEIWEKYLKLAVEAVERKENQKAHDIYKQMMLDLKQEYLG